VARVLQNIANIFRIEDLRSKILFTLGMLVVYRLGAFIPAPGINLEAIRPLQEAAEDGGILNFLQLFSGGALRSSPSSPSGYSPTSRRRSSCR